MFSGKRSEGFRHFVPGKVNRLLRIIDDDIDDDDGGGQQQQHEQQPLFVSSVEKKTIRQTIPRVISAIPIRLFAASLVLRARYGLGQV